MHYLTLKAKLKKLDEQINKGKVPTTLIVFGFSKGREWDADRQRYQDEKGVMFEEYVTLEGTIPRSKAEECLNKAQDLAELRDLAKKAGLNINVLPTVCSISEAWAEDWES